MILDIRIRLSQSLWIATYWIKYIQMILLIFRLFLHKTSKFKGEYLENDFDEAHVFQLRWYAMIFLNNDRVK
jgi:hypothetical protein